MKKVLSLILVIAMIFSFATAIAEEKLVSVEVNGKMLTFDVNPIIVDGRTLVPLRAIFEELGATVDWEDETQTVTSKKGDTTVTLQIGTPSITVNNVAKALDVPGQLVNSRTLVPIRAVSEAFGAKVNWSEEEWKVTIETEPEEVTPPVKEEKPKAENIIKNSECDDIENVWVRNAKGGTLAVETEGDNKYISLSKRTAAYNGIQQSGIADALNKYGAGTYKLTGKIKFDGTASTESAEIYLIAPSYKDKYSKYNLYNKLEGIGNDWKEFTIVLDTTILEFETWPEDTILSIRGNSTTFNADTKLCIDDIELYPEIPNEDGKKLILLGDSICVNYSLTHSYPIQGWGYYMQDFFNENLTVQNKASGGYSTKTFIDGLWDNIAKTLNEGDYVMVSLGINDSGKSEKYHTDPDVYISNLKKFAEDTRAKGAEIVFVTPTPGAWSDKVTNSMQGRSELMIQAANEANVTLLDLNALLYEKFSEIGDIEKVRYEYFIPNQYLKDKGMTDEQIANASGNVKTYGYDYTHFNPEGAKKLAEYIIELLKKTDFGLNEYLK